jgi:hypothetical protein
LDTAGEFACGLGQEGQEGRAACLGELWVLEPLGNADDIERRRCEDVLQAGLG